MAVIPTGPREERAKSHGRVLGCVPYLLAALVCALLAQCQPDPDGTSAGSETTAPPPEAAGLTDGTYTGPAGTGPAADDGNLMEPIFGERRLAKEAIEIDALALMPADLPISEEARQEIADLLRAMQPLDPTLTSDHHDRWFILNKRRIDALMLDTRKDVGFAALHAFTNYPKRDNAVRRTLLGVGARVSPDEAAPLLAELSFNYGHNIEDRAEALLLLGEIAPETFFEGARPYLERQKQPFQTAPQDEFFARGWMNACNASETSPVPMMSQIATNLALGDYARVFAIERLGDHATDPLARAALQTVLVESTGNGYLRRKSAQSVLRGFPREQSCALLASVMELESDINMKRFLDDMIQTNCR